MIDFLVFVTFLTAPLCYGLAHSSLEGVPQIEVAEIVAIKGD